MVKHCISKEVLDCFYLTEENRDEFINMINNDLPKNEYAVLFEDDDYHMILQYIFFNYNNTRHAAKTKSYYYNYWYVKKYDYYGEFEDWEEYSNKDFEKRFKFITDKEYEEWENLWK